MKVFKPLQRQYVPRKAADATLTIPQNEHEKTSLKADTKVVEMYEDDGWKEWQDSVVVYEFTNESIETIPGKLEQ